MSDYDDYDEPTGPDAIAGLTADVRINVPPLDLSTEIGGETIADLIVDKAVARLAGDQDYWPSLRERVKQIRDEEIRAAVKDEIANALTEGFRKTNSYGEPYGDATTLRSVIADLAEKALDARKDSYSNSKTLREILAEEVSKAIKAELAETIADEKAKVIAAVREQAAGLIAEATVSAGLAAKGAGR